MLNVRPRKRRTVLEKYWNNLKAVLIFALCAVNTVLLVTPLMVLAVFKFLVPLTGFRRLMTRQEDSEGGPLPDFTFRIDEASRLLDDPVNR